MRWPMLSVVLLTFGMGGQRYGAVDAITGLIAPWTPLTLEAIPQSRDAKPAVPLDPTSTVIEATDAESAGRLARFAGAGCPLRISRVAAILKFQRDRGQFAPSDDKSGAAPVAILSHGFWQRRYGTDPDVVGRTIRINGTPTTVIGVMPEGFSFPAKPGALAAAGRDARSPEAERSRSVVRVRADGRGRHL
jgi:hypothetical protein